jgi:hypothetical protein
MTNMTEGLKRITDKILQLQGSASTKRKANKSWDQNEEAQRTVTANPAEVTSRLKSPADGKGMGVVKERVAAFEEQGAKTSLLKTGENPPKL